MDLKNGKITVSEVLQNPRAYALLKQEFPQMVQSPLFHLAGGMTLNQVLAFAKGTIPQDKIDRLLEQLQSISS